MSVPVSFNESKPKILYGNEEMLPLIAAEVHRRQRLFGRNIIEKHSSRSWHYILLNSLFDPFNVLLIAISCLSIFLNDLKTFAIMIVMVGISGGIRFFQEQQSETKLNDLASMVKKSITVIRRNLLFEYEEIVDLSDCVPGDFIKLSAGDRVPADIQLVKANSLFVDQSILTGEPMPCLKYVDRGEDDVIVINYNLNKQDFYRAMNRKSWRQRVRRFCLSFLRHNFGLDVGEEKFIVDSNVIVQFDKNDLVFMGTNVISGNALGVVLATGKCTFFGTMSEQISFHKGITSFNKGVKQISLIFILMMAIIMLPIILLKGLDPFNELEHMTAGARWLYAAQFALSVAVGLTPEMLPCILNANLAKGTISLSNRNCLVKRIESITNLGSMNILCTDKTGTLTENFAQLCNVYDYRKRDCLIGLELAYLNSAYQEAFRNLTDQAIIQAYEDKAKSVRPFDLNEFTLNKIREIPFDFSRRKVTVVFEVPEHSLRILVTKGAVNEMLEVCTHCTHQREASKDDDLLSFGDLFKVLKRVNSQKVDGKEEGGRPQEEEGSTGQAADTIGPSEGQSNEPVGAQKPNEPVGIQRTNEPMGAQKTNEPVSTQRANEPVGTQRTNESDLALRKMTPEILGELRNFNDLLNKDGYRVLAVAYQIEHMKLIEKSSDQLNDEEGKRPENAGKDQVGPDNGQKQDDGKNQDNGKKRDDGKNQDRKQDDGKNPNSDRKRSDNADKTYRLDSLEQQRLSERRRSSMEEKDLVFVCYLTFLNPPKTSAAKAIKDLILNHVKVKVLTGDTLEVCKNVCKRIGLSTSSIITSKELNLLNEDELKEAAFRTVIFSQLTPIQKFNIVRVLRKHGQVVGFLGDGINDVLALKEADVGISVDSGTEIAKDAADIILLEKELDVINVGVLCGRRSFVNVLKYISMAISGNFGNVISIFISCIFIPFLPMAPIHILMQNLLYDISQMTMPWDNVDEDVLRKPGVFKMRNLLTFMFFFGPVSSFFDVLTFMFLYSHYGIHTDQDDTMLFQTGWFTVGILTQTLVVHVMRTHKVPVLQSNASWKVYLSTIATLVFGLILPFLSLGKVYNMKELPTSFYYFLAIILVTYCLSAELLKKLYLVRFKAWFTPL